MGGNSINMDGGKDRGGEKRRGGIRIMIDSTERAIQ